MNRKNVLALISVATLLTMSSLSALAGPRHNSYEDHVRVVKVKPIYDSVSEPVTERRCRESYREVVYHDNDSMTGTIAGGMVGGVIGNQFGSGDGRMLMTVAGTLLGGSIGNDLSRDSYRVHEAVPRCEQVTHYREREELVGYRVKYRYNGKNYWTRTHHHPGEYLQVRVSVSPVE